MPIGLSWSQRRGETLGYSYIQSDFINFSSRLYDDPKPFIPNSKNLKDASTLKILYPSVMRNFLVLSWRLLDQRQDDISFAYVPSLRRVLRSDAGERSTPQANSTQAPDDFQIFAGRIPEFNCVLVREQKVLASANTEDKNDSWYTRESMLSFKEYPIPTDYYEVRKTYVIDLIPKDTTYPQSKKRIWIDPTIDEIYYGMSWDRGGNLWKIWFLMVRPVKYAHGGIGTVQYGMVGMDIQLGYSTFFNPKFIKNGNGFKESDFTTSALRKMAK